MKMLFKQRMFSWFDSYDIYDEYGNTLFVVKGQLSWGHCLRIFDAAHGAAFLKTKTKKKKNNKQPKKQQQKKDIYMDAPI